MADRDDKYWHLDKRIPVALLLGLMLQGGGFAFWMGWIDSTVDDHGVRISALERVDDNRADDMRSVEGRLSSLEATSRAQLAVLQEIRAELRRLRAEGR